MNFVQSEWNQFCSSIDSSKCFTVSELPYLSSSCRWIAIKHDVETNVKRAHDIALIEAKYGIRSTFFVQADLLDKNLPQLLAISDLGHEVTYHYDVMDANNGDIQKATNEFLEIVTKFEKAGFAVNSVCPHGNPLMRRNGWSSNKDFFRDSEVSKKFSRIFDLVVQGKEKIMREYAYVSDAGYEFKIIGDIANNDIVISEDTSIRSIDDMFNLVNMHGAIIISTHPHRWTSSILQANLIKARFVLIRKIAIFIAKSNFLKKIISKFYYLAKKI